MKYVLKILAIGDYPEVKLDENEFRSLKRAKDILSNGLAMEEKYEILISNYLELEKEMLNIAAERMVRNKYKYSDFFYSIICLNRLLANLLSAVRLYLDTISSHAKEISKNKPNIIEKVKAFKTIEFDGNVEFRFMENLRNYAQHQGTSVHNIQFSSKSVDSGKERFIVYSLEMASKKEILIEDREFKKKVLDENSEKVDLKLATRIYIEGISRIHSSIRKLLKDSLIDARSCIEDAISSYQNVYDKEVIGLHSIILSEDKIIERVPMLLKWDDLRIELSNTNLELINLRSRYVSSQNSTKI